MSLPSRRVVTSLLPALASIALALGLAACKGSATPAPALQPSTGAPAPAPVMPAPSTPEPAPPLAVGDAAPDVTFALHDGKTLALSSLKGSRVLVYFYPKDDTPGCTAEAEGMRDRYPDLQAAGITVIGVSLQDAASHQAFIAKHELPFPLAVDDGGKLAAAFHVPLKAPGIASRQSFLVGKDGRLEAVWLKVDPATHAADVLAAIR